MPNIYVVAGPNGAGKSTMAARILSRYVNCREFVNADVIARGLSAFNPEGVALEAGRVMLQRLNELAQQRVDFAFLRLPWLRARLPLGCGKDRRRATNSTCHSPGCRIQIWPLPGSQRVQRRVAIASRKLTSDGVTSVAWLTFLVSIWLLPIHGKYMIMPKQSGWWLVEAGFDHRQFWIHRGGKYSCKNTHESGRNRSSLGED
jgi:hypothetical protein